MIKSLKNNVVLKYDNSNSKKNISSGKKICQSNKFMYVLANIMENEDFSYMFNNYFDKWDNIEIFVMFSKVYQSITKQFPTMGKYEKITLVKLLVDTSKTRQIICKEIINFKKNTQIKKNKMLIQS
jgi:hypothetical protein